MASEDDGKHAHSESDEDEDSAETDPLELEIEVEKMERELQIAQLELVVAESQARSEGAEAQDAVIAADREHAAAKRALDQFTNMEQLLLIVEAQLALDKSTQELSEKEQEQAQMLVAFGEDKPGDHGYENSQMVIGRGAAAIDLMKRALALEKGKKRILEDFAIKEKLAALEGELESKASALARAKEAQERHEFEREIALTTAKNKVTFARFDVEKARKDLAKARAKEVEAD